MPIFRSPDPSSCTQCHLAGVDLKNYIRPSHEKTFLSLRDQGLIDLEKPEQSKILRLINMREEDRKGAALINEDLRKAEYAAFAAWIEASSKDPKLRDAPKLSQGELARPRRPEEVIRHARKDRVLASFEKNIWALRFRCNSCHQAGGANYERSLEEFGEKVSWIRPGDAEATMRYLIAKKLVDSKQPERSLILRKPLNEVKHSGGQKMLVGDLGYTSFRSWIDDYAATVDDRYASAADLPKDSDTTERFGTELWLKLAETPPNWADRLLRVEVFAWEAEKRAWESEPIAITDRGVWGKGRLWQHTLFLTAKKGSQRAAAWKHGKPSLPAGRYLARVYVDYADLMKRDWKAEFGNDQFAGEAEFESDWPEGYAKMTVIEARRVQPPQTSAKESGTLSAIATAID